MGTAPDSADTPVLTEYSIDLSRTEHLCVRHMKGSLGPEYRNREH